jgi:hypothetical protein
MKKILFPFIVLFALTSAFSQSETPKVITSDIDNFWQAFDKITVTKDTLQQYDFLNKLYIEKGSTGLKALMEVREYTPKDYLDAIKDYPLFWASVRQNTLNTKDFIKEIEAEIAKFKVIYPEMRPAKMYFTIGAMMTGGTTLDSMVLIGSEIALTDNKTVYSEFPDDFREGRKRYFASNPINDVVLLNVHEYVHTQQKRAMNNLLSYCIREGVAEFVSVKSSGKPSATPAIAFGKQHENRVKKKFEEEMFSMTRRAYWLWSDVKNEFDVRDLGYYIGYALCERHYEKAKDKKVAIKEMIELDFQNEKQIEKFVNDTKYFSAPLSKRFEKSRPKVVTIKEFKNGSRKVSSKTTTLTFVFSQKMNKKYRSTEFGKLGKEHFPKVKSISFAEDGMSVIYEIMLEKNKKYQLLLESSYRSEGGIPLKPFLVEFETSAEH